MDNYEKIHDRITEIEGKIAILKEWQNRVDTEHAVNAERRKNMDERFDRIDAQLATIQSGFVKLFWVVASAFTVAFVTWVVKGGLANVPPI